MGRARYTVRKSTVGLQGYSEEPPCHPRPPGPSFCSLAERPDGSITPACERHVAHCRYPHGLPLSLWPKNFGRETWGKETGCELLRWGLGTQSIGALNRDIAADAVIFS